jgi:hypothetical protein
LYAAGHAPSVRWPTRHGHLRLVTHGRADAQALNLGPHEEGGRERALHAQAVETMPSLAPGTRRAARNQPMRSL